MPLLTGGRAWADSEEEGMLASFVFRPARLSLFSGPAARQTPGFRAAQFIMMACESGCHDHAAWAGIALSPGRRRRRARDTEPKPRSLLNLA
eukprot:739569-Hanusia_phi.AAC.4